MEQLTKTKITERWELVAREAHECEGKIFNYRHELATLVPSDPEGYKVQARLLEELQELEGDYLDRQFRHAQHMATKEERCQERRKARQQRQQEQLYFDTMLPGWKVWLKQHLLNPALWTVGEGELDECGVEMIFQPPEDEPFKKDDQLHVYRSCIYDMNAESPIEMVIDHKNQNKMIFRFYKYSQM
jgi:hypothetical protein